MRGTVRICLSPGPWDCFSAREELRAKLTALLKGSCETRHKESYLGVLGGKVRLRATLGHRVSMPSLSLQRALHCSDTGMLKAESAFLAWKLMILWWTILVHWGFYKRFGTVNILEQRLANFFCKRPDGKYFWFSYHMLSLSHCVFFSHHPPPCPPCPPSPHLPPPSLPFSFLSKPLT